LISRVRTSSPAQQTPGAGESRLTDAGRTQPPAERAALLARCSQTDAPFYIVIERDGDRWLCVDATALSGEPRPEARGSPAARRTLYIADGYPGCPYCRRGGFAVHECSRESCTLCWAGAQDVLTCRTCGLELRPEERHEFDVPSARWQ
jgi:hypothetical protein